MDFIILNNEAPSIISRLTVNRQLNKLTFKQVGKLFAVFLCGIFVIACSSSSNPDSAQPMTGALKPAANNSTDNTNNTAGESALDDTVDLSDTATPGNAAGASDMATPSNTADTSGTANPTDTATGVPDSSTMVPDPLVQNFTLVKFDITVPAYQSDALQVNVTWGDKQLTASWIGDESWTASGDFPINTEQLLSISFHDNNGAITLGTIERRFATGSNSAQDVSIGADEFDTERWDDDSDGMSNFAELTLGADPLDSASPGEVGDINVQDAVHIDYFNWSSPAAAYYEPEIKSLELPADVHETVFVDNLPVTSENTATDIVLSVDGNGTYSKIYDFFIALDMPFNRTSSATRSSQEGTVIWSGTESFSGSSGYYGAVDHVFETASSVDGRTLVQQGSGTVTLRRGSSANRANIIRYNYSLVVNLDSMDAQDMCSILHGTAYHSFERHIESDEFIEFTVNRSPSDESWAWSNTVDGAATSGEAKEVSNRLYCDYLINQAN